ncbi:hypothetical protein CLU79DRAFT_724902 [Phycomyces nitens]|nr:hypothetical protein CLU79DRAFT_724902 [Phycomyces nitens]
MCDSNGTNQPSLLQAQPKIALVLRGNCTFAEKAALVQANGATAMILYDNIPFEKDPYAGIMSIPLANLHITVYYVDIDVGLELLQKLQQVGPVLAGSDGISSERVIKVVLYPSIGGFPSAWEFTLIVVVALLALSFLTSVGMHWHLWRLRRRQRALFEAGLLTIQPNNIAEKHLIDPSQLNLFPVRTIGPTGTTSGRRQSGESSRTARSIRSMYSTKSTRSIRSKFALSNAQVLAASETLPTIDQTPDQKDPEVKPSKEEQAMAGDGMSEARAVEKGDAGDPDNVCVICLDGFEPGDNVRVLPCHHEYHCECIGRSCQHVVFKEESFKSTFFCIYNRSMVNYQISHMPSLQIRLLYRRSYAKSFYTTSATIRASYVLLLFLY